MDDVFSSGRAADIVLVVMALEGGWLWLRARRRSAAVLTDIVLTLAPGACLILALRAALTGAHWTWIAALLALSFPAHLLDVQRRRIGRR